MHTLHDNELLEASYRVSSTYLKTFFTNFEEVFGQQEGVKLSMKTITVPKIDISDEQTTVTAEVDLRFLNPYNTEIHAMLLHANLTAKLQFELVDGFVISGEIQDLQLKVTEFKSYFKTSVTMANINNQLASVTGPFQSLVNQRIADGFGLPVPKPFNSELSKTRLFTYDKFLLIESDPQISNRVTKSAGTISSRIQEDLMQQK